MIADSGALCLSASTQKNTVVPGMFPNVPSVKDQQIQLQMETPGDPSLRAGGQAETATQVHVLSLKGSWGQDAVSEVLDSTTVT